MVALDFGITIRPTTHGGTLDEMAHAIPAAFLPRGEHLIGVRP